jgi:hypothetical protein
MPPGGGINPMNIPQKSPPSGSIVPLLPKSRLVLPRGSSKKRKENRKNIF